MVFAAVIELVQLRSRRALYVFITDTQFLHLVSLLLQTLLEQTLTADDLDVLAADPTAHSAANSATDPTADTTSDGVSNPGRDISMWYGDVVAVLVLLSMASDRIRIGGLVKHPEDGTGHVFR